MSWIKSSRCGNGACVELHLDDDRVLVRDSKLGDDSPTLEFTLDEWADIVLAIREGIQPPRTYAQLPGGSRQWVQDHAYLEFTSGEWDAFVASVRAGEFDFPFWPAGC